MTFQSEDDVREWLRAASGGEVWWFENKRGGTFGFPDAMLVHRGVPMFLELKIIDGGHLVAHPSQLNVVQGLRSVGLHAAFLGGVKGGSSLRLLGPGALKRASETAGFGDRQRYKCAESDGRGESEGSSLDKILCVLADNDFPGSFEREKWNL